MKASYGIIGLAILMACGFWSAAAYAGPRTSGFLHAEGENIVDAKGQIVPLRGVNLGSWLLIELWIDLLDQQQNSEILTEKDMWDVFRRRFGKEKTDKLIQVYRDNFVTEDDIKYIKGMGLNFVRVPFSWRAISNEAYGSGWKYLDKVVEWCEKYDLYCMLDLHGAPGGQNDDVVILGERNKNDFWRQEANQIATENLWEQIAERYRDKPCVAAYDVLNEAWGSQQYEQLVQAYDRLYKKIRKVDAKHVIVFEDALKGLWRLPQPKAMNWDNIAYSVHVYCKDFEETQRRLQNDFPNLKRTQRYFGVPFNIGEFNTIQLDRGGTDYMGKFIFVFNRYGWSWNLWNYKAISDNADVNWGLWGTDASRSRVNLATMDYPDLEKLFASYNTQFLQLNLGMEAALKSYSHFAPAPQPTADAQNVVTLPADAATLVRGPEGNLRVEWQYASPNLGFWKYGDAAFWDFTVPADGVYEIRARYASQAPKAQMEIWMDRLLYATHSIQSTEDWTNYQDLYVGYLKLAAGQHRLKFFAAGESRQGYMNLRQVTVALTHTAGVKLMAPRQDKISLTPFNMKTMQRNGDICVEWQNNPPNIGHWTRGDAVVWEFEVLADSSFKTALNYSTPNTGTKASVSLNGQLILTKELPNTHEWHHYRLQDLGTLTFKAGLNQVTLEIEPVPGQDAGNYRSLELEKVKGK